MTSCWIYWFLQFINLCLTTYKATEYMGYFNGFWRFLFFNEIIIAFEAMFNLFPIPTACWWKMERSAHWVGWSASCRGKSKLGHRAHRWGRACRCPNLRLLTLYSLCGPLNPAHVKLIVGNPINSKTKNKGLLNL